MGLACSVVIYDELGQTESRDLLDALATSMGKRAEPLMIVTAHKRQQITHRSANSSTMDYGYSEKKIKDPSFHLTLFSAPAGSDPWSKQTWKLANPALADFRSLEDVERLALQAQRMPSAEASFRNLILNQRIDTTQQFITMATWKLCGGDCSTPEQLKGRPVFAGLDLGYARDMTALVLVFEGDQQIYDTMPFVWLPGETLQERQDIDMMPYRQWANEGHLLTFPGRVTDPKAVALKIAELHGTYQIKALAYDRWRIEDLQKRTQRYRMQCAAHSFRSRLQRPQSRRRCSGTHGRGKKTATPQSSAFTNGGSQRQSRTRRRRQQKIEQTKEHWQDRSSNRPHDGIGHRRSNRKDRRVGTVPARCLIVIL